MSRGGGFFEGFFCGTVAGVVLGLLYAPQSGEETRRKLREANMSQTNDAVQVTREKTEDLIQNTKDAIEKGFDRLSRMLDKQKDDAYPPHNEVSLN